MYVRRKQNRSGSISIQIVEKRHGHVSIIETVGVAINAEEEAQLRIRGNQRISELKKAGQLSFSFSDSKEDILESYFRQSSPPKVTNIGPELILGKIFEEIGLDAIDEDLFRHITLSRLTYPTSKLKTSEYLFLHHGIEMDISTIYRFLDRFHLKYKDEVERIIYEHSKRILGNIHIVFYDMTTLYFEAEDEDDLRKIGFSKDGKFRSPQILLGLLVGEHGYPIGYDMFEGNRFEGHTLLPMITRIQRKFNLPKPVVVADSGLLSKANIHMLEEHGYSYIIGARIKNETDILKQEILKKAKDLDDGDAIRIPREEQADLIIGYSKKRAEKDKYNRDKGVRRLRKNMASGRLTKQHINNRGYNKFLSIENEVNITLNDTLIAQDIPWDGIKGYITNTDITPQEVMNNYNQLWHIERAFRISKTDLRIRPIYHRKKNRIQAHLCIAFAAYAVYKQLEKNLKDKKLKISPAKAIELVKAIYQISFKMPNSNKTIAIFNKMTKEQKNLCDAFGLPR